MPNAVASLMPVSLIASKKETDWSQNQLRESMSNFSPFSYTLQAIRLALESEASAKLMAGLIQLLGIKRAANTKG